MLRKYWISENANADCISDEWMQIVTHAFICSHINYMISDYGAAISIMFHSGYRVHIQQAFNVRCQYEGWEINLNSAATFSSLEAITDTCFVKFIYYS